MLIRLYSIFDRVAQVFTEPFSAINDAAAIRAFCNAQSQPGTMMFSNPEDFQLFFICEFDNHDGSISSNLGYVEKIADGRPREVTVNEQ